VDSGVGGLENAEDFVGALMSDSSSSNDLTSWEELNGFQNPSYLKRGSKIVVIRVTVRFS